MTVRCQSKLVLDGIGKPWYDTLTTKRRTTNQRKVLYMTVQNNLVPMVIKRDSNGERAMDLFSRLLEERVIDMSTQVDPNSCSLIRATLLYLENEDPEADIDLYIDSPGGHVMSGMAVIDTMRFIKPKVNVYCTGMAASMGSVILAGATGKRYVLPHSQVMLHQVSSGYSGQLSEGIISVEHSYKLNMEIKRFFARCTGRSRKELEEVMDRDTWFGAQAAIDFGLADEIMGTTHEYPHEIDEDEFPVKDLQEFLR